MAVVVVWQDPITGKTGFTALSTDTLPNAAAGSQAWITDQPGTIKQYDGTAWVQTHSGGAALVSDKGFVPSSYDANLTMNGTAQVVTLASGARKVQIGNLGATTEAIRVAFGTSSADAESNLNVTGSPAAATTGYYIPALADAGAAAVRELGIPALATHVAICNAVASDTQVVTVTQGV